MGGEQRLLALHPGEQYRGPRMRIVPCGRGRGDAATAQFLLEYADYLESHVERWTVTNKGFLVPGIKRHYVRINPEDPGQVVPNEDLDQKMVTIHNRQPGTPNQFPAAEIV